MPGLIGRVITRFVTITIKEENQHALQETRTAPT
jgi:hypothetical protein